MLRQWDDENCSWLQSLYRPKLFIVLKTSYFRQNRVFLHGTNPHGWYANAALSYEQTEKKHTAIRNSNRFLHLVRASVSKISPLKLIRFKFVEISYFYSFWIWFGSHDLSFSGIRIRFLFFHVIYCLGTVNPNFPIVSIVIRQISCKITSELAFSVFGAKFDEFLRWFENIHMKFNPLRHSVMWF